MEEARTDDERMVALLWLAKRHQGINDEECERVLDEAEPLVVEIGGPWGGAFLEILRMGVAAFAGKLADVVPRGLRAEALAREADDPWLLAYVLSLVGLMQVWAGDASAGALMNEEAHALVPEGSDDPEWLEIVGSYHNTLAFLADASGQTAESRKQRELSNKTLRRIPHYPGLLTLTTSSVRDLFEAEEYEAIREAAEDALERARQRGVMERVRGGMETLRDIARYSSGELPGFMDELEADLIAFPHSMESVTHSTRERFQFGMEFAPRQLMRMGDWDRLIRLVDATADATETLAGPRNRVALLEMKARALEELGRYQEAIATLRETAATEKEIGAAEARQRVEQLRMTKEIEAQFKLTELERAKNEELDRERQRVEDLLLNVLPAPVVRELKESDSSPPRDFPRVAVLAADIVGFSTISRDLRPDALFAELDEIFGTFDALVAESGAQRLKTIGDAYLAVAGILDESELPASALVEFAVHAQSYLASRNGSLQQMRFGIHVGPVTAGIVGTTRYVYDVFGHTVNTAFRLEAACPPGRICASEDVRDETPDGPWANMGLLELKGVGQVRAFVQ